MDEEKEDFIRDVCYFWDQKGDLERFSGWSEEKAQKYCPHILKAWKEYKQAEDLLNILIKD